MQLPLLASHIEFTRVHSHRLDLLNDLGDFSKTRIRFYTRALGRTLCRLAIGAESRQCDVHPAFRCIVVADAEKAIA